YEPRAEDIKRIGTLDVFVLIFFFHYFFSFRIFSSFFLPYFSFFFSFSSFPPSSPLFFPIFPYLFSPYSILFTVGLSLPSLFSRCSFILSFFFVFSFSRYPFFFLLFTCPSFFFLSTFSFPPFFFFFF
ncbi:hypothetical protein C7A10_32170, partial [Pseudomonas fluorescens]